jgi:hypothetical protein
MGFLSSFKEIRKSSNMDRAEREAAKKDDGLEPLLLVLIEEVRQLRRDFAEDRDERRDERRKERRSDRR